MKVLPFLMLILLLLVGCGADDTASLVNETDNMNKIRGRVSNVFGSADGHSEVIKRGKYYDVEASYDPIKLLKGRSLEEDQKILYNQIYNQVRRISLSDQNIRVIKLRTTSSSPTYGFEISDTHVISVQGETVVRETMLLELTKGEFVELSSSSDAKDQLKALIEVHPFYLIEQYLAVNTKYVESFFVETSDEFDNETNETTSSASITFIPRRLEQWGSDTKDFDRFETSIADIMRVSFEQAPTVDKVSLKAISNLYDNRSVNNTHVIAAINMTRDEFANIVENWDTLRAEIFKKIVYNPLYLLDLKSIGLIESIEFGSVTYINYFIDSYNGMAESIAQVEMDVEETAYAIFDRFSDVNQVIFKARILVPAPEGEVTVDGVNQILNDGLEIAISRSDAEKVNREVLTPQQVIYNFGPIWAMRVLELNLAENIGFGASVREVEVDLDRTSADIHLDTCFWKKVTEGKGNIIENKVRGAGGTALFLIHPPYLNDVTVYAEKVFLDQYGAEEVETMVRLTMVRDNDAQWYNQDIEGLDQWYETTIRENDISESTILCQIMTT